MAAFDPDEFLKGAPAAAPAFDPDAFLKGQPTAAPPSREQEIRAERLKALRAASGEGSAVPGASGIRAYTSRLSDAVTSGLARPMGGLMSVVGGEVGEYFGGKPATVGERWRGGVGAEEDYAREQEKKSEGLGGAAVSTVGSLASGGQNVGRAGLAKLVGQGAVQGGVEGAARNAEDPVSALAGAGVGAGVNAATTGTVGALANRLGRVRQAERTIGEASRGGTSQTLLPEASDKFAKLDNMGIHFGRSETPELANKVNAAVAGYDTAPLNPVLKIMNEKTSRGAMTFSDVRDIQSKLSALKASNDGLTRKMAGEAADAVDDFLHTAKASVPPGGAAAGWQGELKQAKDLYRRGKLAGKVEGIEGVAERAADPSAATKQGVKSYSDKFIRNPDKYNPNSPEQMRLMDEIVRSGRGKEKAADIADTLAKLALPAGGLGLAGSYLAPNNYTTTPSVGALALGLGAKGGSSVLRQQLARQTAGKMDDLLRNIVTGQTNRAGAYVPPAADVLLRAKQDTARGAGKIASSYVYKKEKEKK